MSSPLLRIFAASLLVASLAAVGPRAQTPTRDARAGAQAERAQDCGRLEPSRKLDEYGTVSAAEERARLEKLVALFKAEGEDTKAFIIGYAGRAGRAGEGLARADRAKQILTDESVSHNARINTLDCGRREAPATELWLTPAGASPPPCSPTLDPAPAAAGGGARRPTPRRRGGRP